jgi:hypothetical protein
MDKEMQGDKPPFPFVLIAVVVVVALAGGFGVYSYLSSPSKPATPSASVGTKPAGGAMTRTDGAWSNARALPAFDGTSFAMMSSSAGGEPMSFAFQKGSGRLHVLRANAKGQWDWAALPGTFATMPDVVRVRSGEVTYVGAGRDGRIMLYQAGEKGEPTLDLALGGPEGAKSAGAVLATDGDTLRVMAGRPGEAMQLTTLSLRKKKAEAWVPDNGQAEHYGPALRYNDEFFVFAWSANGAVLGKRLTPGTTRDWFNFNLSVNANVNAVGEPSVGSDGKSFAMGAWMTVDRSVFVARVRMSPEFNYATTIVEDKASAAPILCRLEAQDRWVVFHGGEKSVRATELEQRGWARTETFDAFDGQAPLACASTKSGQLAMMYRNGDGLFSRTFGPKNEATAQAGDGNDGREVASEAGKK